MKKFLLSAIALVGFASLSIAQTAAKAKTDAPAAKPKMTVVKKDAAPAAPAKVATLPAAKPAAPAAKPATTTTAGPVKKDGTPDKRFKANKTAPAATPAGPVKKDGTPDKRFKANKKS